MTEIEGPLKIGVSDGTGGGSRELHIDFTAEFQAMAPAPRADAFRSYIVSLNSQIAEAVEDSTEQQGMLVIVQISEQLMPHIQEDEIVLSETIVIEILSDNPLANLIMGEAPTKLQ